MVQSNGVKQQKCLQWVVTKRGEKDESHLHVVEMGMATGKQQECPLCKSFRTLKWGLWTATHPIQQISHFIPVNPLPAQCQTLCLRFYPAMTIQGEEREM